MEIVHIFASPFWGGGEQYVYDLAKEQSEHGHTIDFFSQRSDILKEKVSSVGKLHVLGFKGIYDVLSAVRMARYLKKNKTDVIHIHRFKDMFTVIFAKMASGSKAKIVLTRHQVKKGKGNILYQWAYKRLHRIIFVSGLAMKEWKRTIRHIPEEKCTVILNSIPDLPKTDEKTAATLRQRYNIGADTPVIMFAGRIVPEKGVDILVESLKILKNKEFRMIFVGTGSENYLRETKKKTEVYGLNDKVIWASYCDDVRSLMAESDIGVCPSIARESFGLTAAEFMQAGKCVITSDNGAQPEFINDGITGMLVRSGDADELALKLNSILEDKQMREQIGTEARHYFKKNLSYDRFYREIMDVYNAPR